MLSLKNKFSYFIVSNYLKMKKKLPLVYLDVSIDNQSPKRLTFEVLF